MRRLTSGIRVCGSPRAQKSGTRPYIQDDDDLHIGPAHSGPRDHARVPYAGDPFEGGACPLVVAPVFNTEVARDAGQAGSIPVRLRCEASTDEAAGVGWT
jgi:hypothetical protein